jgi:hypothetical protein
MQGKKFPASLCGNIFCEITPHLSSLFYLRMGLTMKGLVD